MKTLLGGAALMTALAVVLGGAAASAGTFSGSPVAPDEVLTLDLSGDPVDDNDSAVIIWNMSNATGDVTIEYLPTNPVDEAEGPFLLLDGTLRVTTDIPDGELRLLVIREYSREKREKKGILPGSLRVMRRKRAAGLWRPARCRARLMRSIERATAAPKRQMRRKESGHLGRRGIYETDTYVWAVVDQASDLAVGGMVPEPVTMTCLAAGAGVLLWRKRRRS
ncbi:MAG: PEP-CTERM sorting domain-containing protein [Planctomycetota bacterium]